MSLSDKQWLFLQDVADLIKYAKDNNIKLTGGELYRTLDQQILYVEAGKSQTTKSNHLRRLAIDFNFFIDGSLTYKKEDVQILGDYWESLRSGNSWGGNWKSFQDVPHFEAS